MSNEAFSEFISAKGIDLYREMPWREDTRPYYILVSELMLQQTQVSRVIPKFDAFIEAFPDETSLASASLSDVLTLWQGLGYNRRAKFLHDSAKKIISEFGGEFPTDRTDILSLPGVGMNTAGAIEAYAFNRASTYIETNVRTVYIHHFFNDHFDIDDKHITEKLKGTIDMERPREFYWALMDYGSWLKANGVRNIDQSRHYKKQSKLEGSVRQVRGMIIKELTSGPLDHTSLRRRMPDDERFMKALDGLRKDGLVMTENDHLHLTK